MKADSLQGYLEQHLKVATNITPELIKQLKAQWRKDYVSRYNTKYRDDHVQITFRLSKSHYQKLKAMANTQNVKPTVYCRELITNTIYGNTAQDMLPIKLVLMELVDTIEEAQLEQQVLDTDDIHSKINAILKLL